MSYGQMIKESDEAFAPVPSGQYFAEVKVARHKMSANQKKMFEVGFSILAGPHAGRQVWRNFVISPESPAAMSRFFNDMTTLGADRNFFKAEPSDDQVCAKILNARVQIEVNQREWNGTIRNDISKVTALPVGLDLPQASIAAAAPSVPLAIGGLMPQGPQPAPSLVTQQLSAEGKRHLEAAKAEQAAALAKHDGVPVPAPMPVIPDDDTDVPF